MTAVNHLRYGLQCNKLVHINDVQKGLACNCLCPHCKSPLIAKKGNKNTKHFAHYKLADCNHGAESALHLLAKSIVKQSCKVFVPYIPQTEYDPSKGGKIITFENAIIEKQLSDTIRGDVVLYSGDQYLNVEIKVTHGVDLQKTIALYNHGIPTIEVDLSDIKSSFTPQMIEQRLLGGENTRIIYSPKHKDVFAKLILGEWKEIHDTHYGRYVNDCPKSQTQAYFTNHSGRGGPCECHECNAYSSWGMYRKNDTDFLCYGFLDGIDFSKIEQILHLEKEENHIRSVKLLMSNGSIIQKTHNFI